MTRQYEVQNPHFSVPFQFGGLNGGAFVSEQDDDDDIIDCLKVITAYPIGSREDEPDFGIPDIVFQQAGFSIASALWAAYRRWEPRADTNVQEHIDATNELTEIIRVEAKGRQNA